jgi:hypothetical protein
MRPRSSISTSLLGDRFGNEMADLARRCRVSDVDNPKAPLKQALRTKGSLYEEAIAAGRRALQGNALWAATYRILATCYAHLGRLDDARAVQRLLHTDPGLTVAKATELYGGRDNADVANMLAGLRLAGLPE